jgi:[acyl-carrier-protein] S-malonyltransferase
MSLALLFSPQGSQAVGMGRDLAAGSAAAASAFVTADATLGWSVSDACWNGPAELLNDTRQTQPCLLTVSVAALRALDERARPAPAFVAGHSVGEYAALVAAGVIEFEAALRLVGRRGELMAGASAGGGMAAVIGLERDVVESVGRAFDLVVANDNAPGQVVVSGDRERLAAAEEPMRAAGAKRVIPLPVSGAFHSPLMATIAEELAAALAAETWSDARIPILSNVTGEPVVDAGRIRSLLAEQVRSPVEWVRSVRRMAADGVDTMLELGSGAALVGMVRRIAPDVRAAAINDLATLDAGAQMLATTDPVTAPA